MFGPHPTDRGKLGSKRHLITDRGGIPPTFCVTGASRHDSIVLEELADSLPATCCMRAKRCRATLRASGIKIKARIARKGVAKGAAPFNCRAYLCLAGMGKLRIRFEGRFDIHHALLSLAEHSARHTPVSRLEASSGEAYNHLSVRKIFLFSGS